MLGNRIPELEATLKADTFRLNLNIDFDEVSTPAASWFELQCQTEITIRGFNAKADFYTTLDQLRSIRDGFGMIASGESDASEMGIGWAESECLRLRLKRDGTSKYRFTFSIADVFYDVERVNLQLTGDVAIEIEMVAVFRNRMTELIRFIEGCL